MAHRLPCIARCEVDLTFHPTMRSLLCLLFLSTSLHAELTAEQQAVPLEADAPDASYTKIILLAGSPSNKPGQHEYFAGCNILAECLKQTPKVWPVMVADGWPKNEAIFNQAKAVVSYMDAGEKLAWLTPERWARMKATLDAGAGFVAMHQSVEVPAAQRTEFQSWLGAIWQPDIGCRGHWDMTFESVPTHPITANVTGFPAPKDGWLFNLHFLPEHVTPILTGTVPDNVRKTNDAKAHNGRKEVIAWTYAPPSRGRAFGFTGADLHSSWAIDSQRQLVVNAILWTAGVEVPTTGAPIKLEAQAFTKNLDRKVFTPKKKVTKAQ
jgi:hypothetical protein